MGVDRCRQFRDMLRSSSSTGTGITRCVREVVLTKVRLRLDVPEDPEASDIPLLEEIFSTLPNVTHLLLDNVVVECMPETHSGDALDDGYPDKPLRSLFTMPRLRTLYIDSVSLRSASDAVLLLAAFPQVSSLYLRDPQMPRVYGPVRWPPELPENRKADSMICIRELTVERCICTGPLLTALRHPPFKCAFRKLDWDMAYHEEEEGHFQELVDESRATLKNFVVYWFADSLRTSHVCQ